MREILTINGGSSSIKFATYSTDPFARRFSATQDVAGQTNDALFDWLEQQVDFKSLTAVGHRIVHGLNYVEPLLLTPQVIAELLRISPYDPQHMPAALAWIEGIRTRYPSLPQVACFDTAFHSEMPQVAQMVPIPRHFGVRRYGFHGLSYEFLMEELARVAGPQAAQGRVIFAHLGNGSSLAAVQQGKSIDTSMGFTPAGGLPMGTRSGDIDPGVAWYLLTAAGLSPAEFHRVVNHESGLLGVSETSSDMRKLLEIEGSDKRAAEAIEMFCYQTRKWIGSFAAALGGLDTLIFSGGIGENAPQIRARICSGMQFLGIELDPDRNNANAPVISRKDLSMRVRVMRTNEELMIARHVCRLLDQICDSL